MSSTSPELRPFDRILLTGAAGGLGKVLRERLCCCVSRQVSGSSHGSIMHGFTPRLASFHRAAVIIQL